MTPFDGGIPKSPHIMVCHQETRIQTPQKKRGSQVTKIASSIPRTLREVSHNEKKAAFSS